MIAAVFDSNVIVGAAGWRGESCLCLVSMARRRVRVFTSAWILEEVRRTVTRLQAERVIHQHDPWPLVNWFADTARIISPAPTGKQRSRDPEDDPILGAALTAGVRTIVTFDKDLIALEKPFGIEVIRPGLLLAHLQRARPPG